MAELSLKMKHEIDACRRSMDQIKASPEWEAVKHLVSVKLLSDVLDHGLEATQSAEHVTRPKQR